MPNFGDLRPPVQSLGFGVITSWLTTQKSFFHWLIQHWCFQLQPWSASKTAARTSWRKTRRNRRPKVNCCPAPPWLHIQHLRETVLFLIVHFPVLSSDQTEDASKQSIDQWTGVRWREEGGHRRLPPVQTAPRWQRGAVCPADLQGLVHPAQRFPLPQFTVGAAEYVTAENRLC